MTEIEQHGNGYRVIYGQRVSQVFTDILDAIRYAARMKRFYCVDIIEEFKGYD